MSFITVDDANSILGSDFAPDSDKARLVQLANVWMKNGLVLYQIQLIHFLKMLRVKLSKEFWPRKFITAKTSS